MKKIFALFAITMFAATLVGCHAEGEVRDTANILNVAQ
jgi:hypothetical protein